MQIRDRIRELRRVKASTLRPNPKNWRTHPKAQRDALQGVLAEIGYADALLARELDDGSLEILDGHLRAETTPDSEVPVLVVDLSQAEADMLLATLDPLAGMAQADPVKLDALLKELCPDNQAVAELLESLAKENQRAIDQMVVEDRPPVPLPEAVTRTGDLWVLEHGVGKGRRNAGNAHRLLCGDSTSIEDVRRVMLGERAAMAATDPPYLVDYTGERPKHGNRDSGKDWSAVYKEVGIKDADAFFTKVFGNVLQVLADRGAIYCWHAHRRCGVIQRVWEELGILDHQQIIWVKPASVFGRVFWHFRHEPCMMGWRKGSMPPHPPHDRDHCFDSVWEVGWEQAAGMAGVGGGMPAGNAAEDSDEEEPDRAGNRGRGKARPGDNEHPTQKPVELFARPMRRHTRAGDTVFEPFSGSGTQIIAAQQLGRRCCAIELEPVFVDVAIRRWQAFTGGQAVLEGTTTTWSQVARDRKVKIPIATKGAA